MTVRKLPLYLITDRFQGDDLKTTRTSRTVPEDEFWSAERHMREMGIAQLTMGSPTQHGKLKPAAFVDFYGPAWLIALVDRLLVEPPVVKQVPEPDGDWTRGAPGMRGSAITTPKLVPVMVMLYDDLYNRLEAAVRALVGDEVMEALDAHRRLQGTFDIEALQEKLSAAVQLPPDILYGRKPR